MTPEDVARFIIRHGIRKEEVLDARGMTRSQYQEIMKVRGMKIALNVSACRQGHRIRVRSGHCAVCNPKSFHFVDVFSEPGFVYMAGSTRAGLIKVGSSLDVEHRIDELNNEGYAGLSDWEFLLKVYVPERGRCELSIHGRLKGWLVSRPYFKGDEQTYSRETFNCSLDTAIEAMFEELGESEKKAIEYTSSARRRKY